MSDRDDPAPREAGRRSPPAEARPDPYAMLLRPRRRPVLAALPVIAFVAIAVIFLIRLEKGGDPSAIPSALVGRPAPATPLPALAGVERDGAPVPGFDPAALKGKVTLVNVFASWCGPCREEHPVLMGLAGEAGLRVVGLNYKDDPENARRFLGALGNPYAAIGTDENGRAALEWGVYGVPETFVVGPDATIRAKAVGPITEADLTGSFGAAIAKAQAEIAAAPPAPPAGG